MFRSRQLSSAVVSSLRLTHQPCHGYLKSRVMDKYTRELQQRYPNTNKFYLSMKRYGKLTVYLLKHGSYLIYKDLKFIFEVYGNKQYDEITGSQHIRMRQSIIDGLKFIPYSFFLVVPLAETLIPPYIYLFPNMHPSQYVFDKERNKHINEEMEKQEKAFKILRDKYVEAVRSITTHQLDLVKLEHFRKNFQEIKVILNNSLNYRNMSSEELLTITRFLNMNAVDGTNTINKIVNLFTHILPTLGIKIFRFIKLRIFKMQKNWDETVDPIENWKDFRILKFDYGPFEFLKRKLLLKQIDYHYNVTGEQDKVFQKQGIDSISLRQIRDLTRHRGIPTITCYPELRKIFKTQWIAVTTHPKVDTNLKIWYGVILYHNLKDKNRLLR